MATLAARDQQAFDAHWKKIMADESVFLKTIIYEDQVAGYLVSFIRTTDREVGYWLGKEFWGKGIATQALSEFLKFVKIRPLHARVAKHNIASRRVLEKCGFTIYGEDTFPFENSTVEDFVLILE